MQYREERIALVGRNPRLPGIYEAFNHPLLPAQNAGRTFVIRFNAHPAAMNEAAQYEKTLKVPQEQLAELEAAGKPPLFELCIA